MGNGKAKEMGGKFSAIDNVLVIKSKNATKKG